MLQYVFFFFGCGVENPVLELQFQTPLRVVLLCFAIDSLPIALLGAAAACVILLSFAAESRELYWSGCIKVAIAICHQIFSILALVILLLHFIVTNASRNFSIAKTLKMRKVD